MLSILQALLPWYAWAGGGVVVALAIAAVTYLGLWPIVVLALRRIPPKAWIAAAVLLLLVGLHFYLEGEALAKRDATHAQETADLKAAHKIEIDRQRAAFQKQIADARDAAQHELDGMAAQVTAANAERDRLRVQAAKTRADLEAQLKKGFSAYVSPLQFSRCPDIPRGYLLRRANAAAYANGAAESAGPPASAAALDEPSGVSLAALDATDVDAAGAFRACRDRVIEWDRYGDAVDDYLANLKSIFETKGKP